VIQGIQLSAISFQPHAELNLKSKSGQLMAERSFIKEESRGCSFEIDEDRKT
jgi:hypothetical protein